jgi:RNA polymerase sigma-70 factor (ECF subfamily)
MSDWVTTTEVLDRLRDDDAAAWELFVSRFRKPVLVLAGEFGLRGAEADDVAQEALLACLEGLRRGDYERGKGRLRSWLYGIARMKALKAREKTGRRAREVSPVGLTAEMEAVVDEDAVRRTFDAAWEAELARQALDRVKREVGSDTWAAFALVQFDGLSPADAATKLGTTRNAVFIAKHRVLKRARALAQELADA